MLQFIHITDIVRTRFQCRLNIFQYVITIQDEIKNLTAEAENIATVFTEETKVHWNISKGTHPVK